MTEVPTTTRVRLRRPRLAVLIILGVLAPIAVFLLVRIPYGCSVLNPLGLPWPAPVTAFAIVVSVVVALAALVAVVAGLFDDRTRVVSIVIAGLWVAAIPGGFFLLFLTVFGDPGSVTCVMS